MPALPLVVLLRSALPPLRALLLGALAVLALAPSPLAAFQKDRAGFSLRFQGEVTEHTVAAAFVMPGESILLAVAQEDADAGPYALVAKVGESEEQGDGRWSWTAPAKKGHYTVKVVQKPTGRAVTLNVFVMVPASPASPASPAPSVERLNGYTIGSYPEKALHGLEPYRAPRGFVEVTAANRSLHVAPHFTLGQFLCKQGGGYPKYVVLRPRLPLKLEAILEAVNESGTRAETLAVLSGYRTPAYNASLKDTEYSRHIYGDAADVFVDPKGSGRMADLNHDGKVDEQDAVELGAIVDHLQEKASFKPYVGGVGVYKANAAHGPFVHVDVRGTPAHWRSWDGAKPADPSDREAGDDRAQR